MEIIINYESSWRNSFLDGDNNSPLPKKGRNFIASIKELKKPNKYIERNIKIDLVKHLVELVINVIHNTTITQRREDQVIALEE